VHDLVIHPRDAELVIATHGRGIFIMDVMPLQEMVVKEFNKAAHLFTIRPAMAYRQRTLHTLGIKTYSGENPPYGAGIYLYLREVPKDEPLVIITDSAGKKLAEFKAAKSAGLQRLSWRLAPPGSKQDIFRAVPPGTYTATIRTGEWVLARTFDVQVDD
jgi:hypothetical protein